MNKVYHAKKPPVDTPREGFHEEVTWPKAGAKRQISGESIWNAAKTQPGLPSIKLLLQD